MSRLLQLSEEIEGKRKIYLHTQTWSHRAVKLYEKFGFYITKEPNLFKYANDQYEQATALLEEIYSKYPRRLIKIFLLLLFFSVIINTINRFQKAKPFALYLFFERIKR